MRTAELMLYGVIGADINAADFVNEIRSLDVDQITVRVNSPGGSTIHGHAIYNALSRHPAHKIMEIDSRAASAASYIVLAGDEIRIHENAEMMVHCGMIDPRWLIPMDGSYMNAKALEKSMMPDIAKVVTALRRLDGQIAAMYAARTGHTRETWLRLMDNETFFSAEEAVKKGLADTMIPNKIKPSARVKSPAACAVHPDATSPAQIADLVALAEQINRELPEFVAEVPGIEETPSAETVAASPQAMTGDGGPSEADIEAARQAKLAEYAARAAEVQA